MSKQSSNTGALSQIYLDSNATTPVLPQAAEAALACMETLFGNPSSSHITGLRAKQVMDNTRRNAKEVIGAGQGEVIFTSGATEGIQTAIISALHQAKQSLNPETDYCVLYGATEHKAVPESLKHWLKVLEIDATLMAIPVDKQGLLDTEFLAQHAPNALLICTMAVNNETGVFQDLELIEQVIRANNPDAFWMVDCVQALGKLNLTLADTTIDYAPFSGHKLYAPKGIGFVYIRENAPFTPFIAGGGQEGGLRSGTENLPGMAALNVVFEMLLGKHEQQFACHEVLAGFRQQLTQALRTAFPAIVFNHNFDVSVATTLNFSIAGFSSKEMMDLFDAANIRVSSGSACSSKVTRSFVLDAMGLPAWQSESAIRLSFGPAMTQQDVDAACQRIEQSAAALTHSCLALADDAQNMTDKAELNGLMQFKVGGSCTWLYVDQQHKQAVIIDPLPQISERLATLLQCQGLSLVAAIDTHGHADHQSSRGELLNLLGLEQYTDHLGWPEQTKTTCLNGQRYPYITVGEQQLIAVPSKGHTSDSISLLLTAPNHKETATKLRYAFCGDTILMGTLGRSNFECSDSAAMYQTLIQLEHLIGQNTLICPSHDYNNEFTTTIGAEMERIPLLKQVIELKINQAQFVLQKSQLDQHIVDSAHSEIICGALTGQCQQQHITEYNAETLAAVMDKPNNLMLIDIREPHEFALQHNASFDHNVPLTRLVDFIERQQLNKTQPFVLVCRSGSRSHVAAQALSRLGFSQVGHLKGGYALSA
ncbi:aminotransferase class V-fold PLP-dependent enzyme [Psychrobium sp. 1_MG-2023]|uniref:aminotransferase class V-fold PLP-dependent enzyme n=1 Tax=Psychrobium sp. 1_MG-2023 TaxID=3062624 RepID=UPI000C329622|nr:aminotransferase class V-fold PLP-dependent enzyme [Psychrobium sp. 1_MG-2023]MDP2560110.1 aminotransferase class V-fold PLP-dependent enzyme [Psychrobium sp. 1_MG-2023]PKF56925.1 aminotransferase class V [Alteromonadales bacterium alter-6D02]